MPISKNELRQRYLLKRELLSATERAQKSQKIVTHLMEFFKKHHYQQIAVFYPVRGEVNLLPLIEQKPTQFLFPITNPNNTVSFYAIKDLQDFTPGNYNIPEPTINNKHPQTPDCIILPAIAYDLLGNRLGYGKGCYDRYLKDFKGTTVGVNYSECLTDQPLPTENFDQPVAYIITENGITHTP